MFLLYQRNLGPHPTSKGCEVFGSSNLCFNDVNSQQPYRGGTDFKNVSHG